MNEEGNVTAEVKLETIEQLREAIGVLAREVLSVKSIPLATEKLVRGMDARIRTLTRLVDHLHNILEKNGMVPPLPTGGVDVN